MFGNVNSSYANPFFGEFSQEETQNPSNESTESTKAIKKAFASNDATSATSPAIRQAASSAFQLSPPSTTQGFILGSGVRQIVEEDPLEEVANALKMQKQDSPPQAENQMVAAQEIPGLIELAPQGANESVYRRDVRKPKEAAEFLEEVLERLQYQISKNEVTYETLKSLIQFVYRHTPHPELVRSYTCLMRLLPKLPKGEYMVPILEEMHRCLRASLSISESRLTADQFVEICLGLEVYTNLQNKKLSREIFDIFSKQLSLLPPQTIKNSHESILIPLLFLESLKYLSGEEATGGSVAEEIKLIVKRKEFNETVNAFAKKLVGRTTFSSAKTSVLFKRLLSSCLRRLDYPEEFICSSIPGNYPSGLTFSEEDFEKKVLPLQQITKRTFAQGNWTSFLHFLKRHEPQSKYISSYARLLRLWGSSFDLKKMEGHPYFMSHVREVHRCLSDSLKCGHLPIWEFTDVCQGLKAYTLLENDELLQEMLNILSEKAKSLPIIVKKPEKAICDILNNLYPHKKSYPKEVGNVLKNFIDKIDFSTKEVLFPMRIAQSLQKAGYNLEQVQEIMGKNYPSTFSNSVTQNKEECENDGGGRKVHAMQCNTLAPPAYSIWSSTNGASGVIWGSPQNSFSSTPGRWQN